MPDHPGNTCSTFVKLQICYNHRYKEEQEVSLNGYILWDPGIKKIMESIIFPFKWPLFLLYCSVVPITIYLKEMSVHKNTCENDFLILASPC